MIVKIIVFAFKSCTNLYLENLNNRVFLAAIIVRSRRRITHRHWYTGGFNKRKQVISIFKANLIKSKRPFITGC